MATRGTYNATIRPWGGTAADLASENATPLVRELVLELDTYRLKVGDGSTAYASLPYFCEQNLFDSIAVSGQTTVTANSITTGLTFAAGANMTITTNNATKTITFAATSGSSATLSDGDYGDIIVSGTGTAINIDTAVITTAARTVLDDTTVANMVDTLGGASSTGSGGLVRKTSATLITPDLGTPSAVVLTNATGLPVTTGLANIATARILGRVTAGTGAVEVLTGTQATTILDAFVGDSGSGGTKGLVPAPSAGDAAKFLKASGGWALTGTVTSIAVSGNNGIGVAGSPITTSGTITLSLGAITPTSVNSIVLSGSSTPTLSVTGTSSISGSNSGDQTITLTSDVTGSGTGSFATTIANNVVTNAKLATTSTARILGRITAGTGNVEYLTGTQATSLLDNFVGDSGTGGTKGLVPAPSAGDAAKFLKADGTWSNVSGAAGGTVTSVAISGTNGLTVSSGSPITSSGTIALTIGDIGGASAVKVNGLTITPSTGTLTITNAKTLTASNTLTFTGTDGSSVAFGGGGTVLYSAVTSVGIVGNNGIGVSGSPVTSSGNITLSLGAITPTSVNGLTITTTTGTLTVLSGKTITLNNTLTYNGTDGSSMQFGGGGTVAYTENKLSAFAATSSFELASTISDETGSGSLVFANSPTLSAPTITTPSISGGTHTRITDFGLRAQTGTSAYDLKINSTETLTANHTLTITSGDADRVLTFTGDASIRGTNTGDQTFTASGDATAPGSTSNLALTLATVNGNVGTFGSSTSIPSLTVNAKGLVTAISGNVVIAPAGTLTGTTLASNVVTSSLTTVGTIGTGAWQATKIGLAWGGTNADLSATGGTSQVLMQASTGANITVAQLAASDLSNGVQGSGAVVLASGPTISSATLSTAFIDTVYGVANNTNIRAASGTTMNFQAYDTTSSVYRTVMSVFSGASPFADLDGSRVTIGGNYIYRQFGNDVDVADGGSGRSSATAYAPIVGGTTSTGAHQSVSNSGATVGQVLTYQGTTSLPTWTSVGSGTVTSVAVSGANGIGVSGSPVTSSGTIALSLGDITPTSVTTTGTIQAGTSTNGVIKWWDAANSQAFAMTAGNLTLTLQSPYSLSAVTFIGNLVGNASTASLLQTTRSIFGANFNGGSDISSPVSVPFGGSSRTSATAYMPICGGTTSVSTHQSVSTGTSTGQVLRYNGASALPDWSGVRLIGSSGGAQSVLFTGATLSDITFSGAGSIIQFSGGGALSAGASNDNTLILRAWDGIDGGPSNVLTITSKTGSNHMTADLSSLVTIGGDAIYHGGTAYAPVCGGTTAAGANQSASTGMSTSGTIFTSNGSSTLPSFQSLKTLFETMANALASRDHTKKQVVYIDTDDAVKLLDMATC